ncbi:MAG: class I SAM-dependent methyltransferase [Lentisphaerae bacterium]|nr:class I SAM-dependent methyltransferase [Lentisphaerota bacterium]MCP4100541.1 class I SAM-dependent methyltransferase [Lentisphaerota bacterium]
MKQTDKNILLDVFNIPVVEILQEGNKLALITKNSQKDHSSSFIEKSWDRYFIDLSFGSYRKLVTETNNIGRERTWHYLLKNLAFVDKLYSESANETKILDIGCSSGYLRRFIEGNHSGVDSAKIYYWGVDIREDKIREATHTSSNIETGAGGDLTPTAFIVHDTGINLPFKSNSFDYVSIFEMMKYLPISEGKKLISEIKRVLKEGGTLSISTPTSFEYYKEKRPENMISLSPNELIDILESNGLIIDHVYGSQSSYKFLKDNIKSEHKVAFDALNDYFPNEITTAILTPLYPEYSTQITLYAHV